MEFQVWIIFEYSDMLLFENFWDIISLYIPFHSKYFNCLDIIIQIQEIEYFHDLTISTFHYNVKMNFKFEKHY